MELFWGESIHCRDALCQAYVGELYGFFPPADSWPRSRVAVLPEWGLSVAPNTGAPQLFPSSTCPQFADKNGLLTSGTDRNQFNGASDQLADSFQEPMCARRQFIERRGA